MIAKRWLWIIALSLLGVVSCNTLIYLALTMTTSAQGALIHAATPFVTMALAIMLTGERFDGRQLAGSLLSLCGAILVITGGVLSSSFHKGDGLMLISVLVLALFSVLLKLRPREMPALALLTVVILVGVVLQAPLYLAFGASVVDLIEASPETIASALYLGVFASAVAYWLWDKGIEAFGPTAASQYIHLMPIAAAVIAFCFLDETLSVYQWLGGALVLLGLITAQSRSITKTLN
jgi:drug/metabolite transporter (DMT)-like permease